MDKSYTNLLLRRQEPHDFGSYNVYDVKYCDEVLFAHPLIANTNCRGARANYFHLLCLNGENDGQLFVELERFQNEAGEYKTSLSKKEILKEFYCVEDFRKKARPLMCKAKLTPSEEFRDLFNGNFRSKKFKLKKMFPENETYDLIATDGQHLLVKKDNTYTFLPYPYCNEASWQVDKTSSKSQEEILNSMDKEIKKACQSYARKFSMKYGINVSFMAKYANFSQKEEKNKE